MDARNRSTERIKGELTTRKPVHDHAENDIFLHCDGVLYYAATNSVSALAFLMWRGIWSDVRTRDFFKPRKRLNEYRLARIRTLTNPTPLLAYKSVRPMLSLLPCKNAFYSKLKVFYELRWGKEQSSKNQRCTSGAISCRGALPWS